MENDIEIIRELKQLLTKELGDNILEVILFGSRMKRIAEEFSDYDVLIILKNDYDWKYKRQVMDLCYEISLDHDVFLDIKIISLNELNHTVKGIDPLYQDAIREGIHV